jgi:hypothetical protein
MSVGLCRYVMLERSILSLRYVAGFEDALLPDLNPSLAAPATPAKIELAFQAMTAACETGIYCRPKYYFRTVTDQVAFGFLLSLNRLRSNSRVSAILGAPLAPSHRAPP